MSSIRGTYHTGRPAGGGAKAFFRRSGTQSAVLSEVLNGTDHLRGVGVLVVVPRHDLNLIGVVVDLSDHGLGSVEQRAVTHTDDVGRNDLILVVAEGRARRRSPLR